MKKIVIIGNSASGVSAAKTIRKNDTASNLTIISQEKHPAYLRPRILDYLSGQIKKEELFYLNSDFYSKNNIELVSGRQVLRINEKRKVVFLDDKSNLDYDVLLLASGAVSRSLEIKGEHKYGVFEIRYLDDIEKILEIIPVVQDVCIIGAGRVGLGAAVAFRKRNLDVTVVTKSKFALSSYLDETASLIAQKRIEDFGVRFIFSQDVVEIIGVPQARAVKLESGKVISANLILIAKGSTPNFNFIKDTNIQINKGIVVNENFQTNISNIFASGEVCECKNRILDKFDINHDWVPALEQGEISAQNITENLTKYDGFLNLKIFDFFGLGILSLGEFITTQGIEEKIFFDDKNLIYKKILIKDNRIIGTILVGDLSCKDDIIQAIELKSDSANIKNSIFG